MLLLLLVVVEVAVVAVVVAAVVVMAVVVVVVAVVVVVVVVMVVVVVVVALVAAAAAAAAAGGGGALLLKIQNEFTHLLAFLVVDPHTLSFLGGSYSKLLSLNNRYRLCTNWVLFWLHRGPSSEGKHLVVLFGFTGKKI